MRILTTLPARFVRHFTLQCVMLSAGLLVGMSCSAAQTPANQPSQSKASTAHAHHRAARKKASPQPVVQTPPAPPMPHWPVNDQPSPASVVWDANGLRIDASNSSLQQILNEVSSETGSRIEGSVPDQRVFGDYGPGQARDVLSELLQGSGYNVILAGDLGKGAPRDIVLSPRPASGPKVQNPNPGRPQSEAEDEISDQQEDQPQPPVQPQQMPGRPGFGPNGPIRTPQQIMEEMQQRQQQQLQQQQQAPQQNPQQ